MEALIAFIVCWLVLTAAVGTAVRHVVHRRDRLRRRSRRPAGLSPHPLCVHCGYPAHGLPHHRCPECGADLRISGIEHPTRR